jgi:ring-1,2-phenylacetyl-CoA epoxidase subunit PaaC
LQHSQDDQIAAIAAKSIKEVRYHQRFSSEWLIRLGDGTPESRQKMQQAVDDCWMYTGELCETTDLDREMAEMGIGVDPAVLKPAYDAQVTSVLTEAALKIPEAGWQQSGGKSGFHTEQLGYVLADLQWMQRAYPGAKW